MAVEDLLADDEYREELAAFSYYRERAEQAAVDREQELGDATYYTLTWESLSDDAKRPYRTAVTVCCEQLAGVFAADV
jgi:hypothetical protein